MATLDGLPDSATHMLAAPRHSARSSLMSWRAILIAFVLDHQVKRPWLNSLSQDGYVGRDFEAQQ